MIWLLMVGCMGKAKLIHKKKSKIILLKNIFSKIIFLKKKYIQKKIFSKKIFSINNIFKKSNCSTNRFSKILFQKL